MLLLRQASFFSFMGIKAGVETQHPQGPGRLSCQLDVLPGASLLPPALHTSAAGSVLTLESCRHLRRSSRYIKPSAQYLLLVMFRWFMETEMVPSLGPHLPSRPLQSLRSEPRFGPRSPRRPGL